MDSLKQEDIRQLMESQNDPCVTIYMPTDPTGANGEQDMLRLKNLVVRAEKELAGRGMRGPEAQQFVEPARGLLRDPVFWDGRGRGLAIFLTRGMFRSLRLPLDFAESLAIGTRFYIRQLLPVVDGDGHFFLLAISQNQVRLFEGNRYVVEGLAVDNLPQNMEAALNYDKAQKVGQTHSASQGRGKQAAVFHGQGAKADAHKNDLEKYCRAIDAAVHPRLRDSSAPLILAGVDYELPIYRRVSNYAGVLDESVAGNPDHLKPKQLHAKAWPIAELHLKSTRRAIMDRYERLAGSEKTADQVAKIVVSAREGKVDTLLISAGGQSWGVLDPETGDPQIHAQWQSGDEDMLELAAVETLVHRGKVHVVDPDQMPDNRLVAALFRY